MVAITLNTVHQTARVREQAQDRSRLFSRNCSMPSSVTGCDEPQRRPGMRALSAAPRQVITIDERTMIAMQMTSPDVSWRQTPRDVRPPRASKTVNAPASCRQASPQPSRRNFSSHSIPASSMRLSRHFSSAATRKASGSPVTPRGGSVEFSCWRTPHCHLPGETAGRRDVQTSFPSERFELDLENNGQIRLSRTLDR